MLYLKFLLILWMEETFISNDSTTQICKLLALAFGLKPLNEELPEMSVPLGKPKPEKREMKEKAPPLNNFIKSYKILCIGRDVYTEIIRQQYIITEERIIQKMTDGSIKLIKDWNEIKRDIVTL